MWALYESLRYIVKACKETPVFWVAHVYSRYNQVYSIAGVNGKESGLGDLFSYQGSFVNKSVAERKLATPVPVECL